MNSTTDLEIIMRATDRNGKFTKSYIDRCFDLIRSSEEFPEFPLLTGEKMFLMPLYLKLKELVK